MVIPVFGQHDYTRDIVADLATQTYASFDVAIIDNGGDYCATGTERVITPGENLGWAAGSNRGFREGFSTGYSHVMTLNNDTRISPHFIAGIMDPRLPDDAGIIAPLYDDHWPNQRTDYLGPAADYRPAQYYRRVPFVDGTCLTLTRAAFQQVGVLDTQSFGTYSWGSDFHLCFRATLAGFGCYVTETSFMNHLGRKTAHSITGRQRYWHRATLGKKQGIRRTLGRKKWDDMANQEMTRIAFPTST